MGIANHRKLERHSTQLTDDTNYGKFVTPGYHGLTQAAKTRQACMTKALKIINTCVAQYQDVREEKLIIRTLL